MASREFILKRIEGKEKEIEKLNKKISRIEEAKASNWEKNPYYYNENDLKYTKRDLERAIEGLEGYKKELEVFDHKANSRNIQVILDFLESWKQRVREYYEESIPRYIKAREAYYEASSKHCEWHNNGYTHKKEVGEEEYKRIYKELDNEYESKRKIFYSWDWLGRYLKSGDVLNYEKLNKDLDEDANAKYDFIIERTQAIVTEITDATNLSIGSKGDLNGFIIGTTGKAKVETIGAGGYNEHVILDSGRHGQRYHFRTLINKMK